jgi:hypothetical protein
MKNLFKALPALVGVFAGVLLYVINVSPQQNLTPLIVQLTVVAIVAVAFLIAGNLVMEKYPRLGMILIEFWIVSAITLTAAATFFLIWVTINSPDWFKNLKPDESKAVSGAIVGAITACLGIWFTKDIGEGKGFFTPGYQFKKCIGRVFLKNAKKPERDTREHDAILYDNVRGTQTEARFEGWGQSSRWKRASILSRHFS